MGGGVSAVDLEFLRPDDFLRSFIRLCDGTRNKEAIVAGMMVAFGDKEFRIHESNGRLNNAPGIRGIVTSRYEAILGHLEGLRLLVGGHG
jgi:hypothetical protein